MRLYLHLIYSFLKIGLFGFGGGYAMLSLIQSEVVTKHQWLTTTQFSDLVAISQMTPGPIGINMATYAGYASTSNMGTNLLSGVLGSLIATISLILPSFLLMFIATKYLQKHKNDLILKNIFITLRPVVVGLIGAAALLLMNKDNFNSYNDDIWQFGISIFLFIFTLIGSFRYHYNPIFLLILAGFTGWILL